MPCRPPPKTAMRRNAPQRRETPLFERENERGALAG
jgi:hypothetical protein